MRILRAIIIIFLALLASSSTAISDERIQEQEKTSVPCKAPKCRLLDLWNELPPLEAERYARLQKLQDSLLADPPGLVRSLDREETLKELLSSTEQLTKIYREMLELERK